MSEDRKASGKGNGGGKSEEFEAKPYLFKTEPEGTCLDSVQVPPPWLLIDHTIAVLWSIYSGGSASKTLSISQLLWVHELIKGIRNNDGEVPPDIQVCLQDIQDCLIAKYAEISKSDVGRKNKEDDMEDGNFDEIDEPDDKRVQRLYQSKKMTRTQSETEEIFKTTDEYEEDEEEDVDADERKKRKQRNKDILTSITYKELTELAPNKIWKSDKVDKEKQAECSGEQKEVVEAALDCLSRDEKMKKKEKTEDEVIIFLTQTRLERLAKMKQDLKKIDEIEELIKSNEKRKKNPDDDTKIIDQLKKDL